MGVLVRRVHVLLELKAIDRAKSSPVTRSVRMDNFYKIRGENIQGSGKVSVFWMRMCLLYNALKFYW